MVENGKMIGYSSDSAIKITRFMAKIEDLVKKEFKGISLEESKVLLNEEEVSFSIKIKSKD